MGVMFSLLSMLFIGYWSWELRFWFMLVFSFLVFKYLMVDSWGVYMYYFYVDSLSGVLVLLSLWTSSLMLLSSYNSIKINNNKVYIFSLCVLLLCLVVMLFFLMDNMLMFYLFFELSLIPTLFLILGWGYQPERLQAGMYMMMYTVMASLPLLLCILLMSYYKGTVNMNMYMYMWILNLDVYWFVGFLFAFLVKLPLYYFHLWLPKAHVEAPISGSMILASVLLKLGGYGIMRFLYLFNFMGGFHIKILMVLCVWGGIMTSIICVGQSDIKSLIAYSSVGHMGVMLGGMMSGFILGWEGALLMMICHGMCSSGLFCLGNLIYEKVNSRSLFLYGGMINYNPMMSLFMFLLCICNMGAPPFVGLVSEVMLYMSLYMYSFFFLLFIIIMVFLGGLYNLLMYVMVQHGEMMSFMKVMKINKNNENLLLLLHIIPLLGFILNVGYISKMFF
uniref:NADH dehydrogenase subunit 4 n=1 Tax=Eledone cirrhosa TaxID=102876 RepID=UPI0022FD8E26|nr:NADH dehydrogenase subunit 4 [Eledone cirrhosa]WAP91611.1 NADH dehydrogenase subunit 4 [Eledone cirrhosa]